MGLGILSTRADRPAKHISKLNCPGAGGTGAPGAPGGGGGAPPKPLGSGGGGGMPPKPPGNGGGGGIFEGAGCRYVGNGGGEGGRAEVFCRLEETSRRVSSGTVDCTRVDEVSECFVLLINTEVVEVFVSSGVDFGTEGTSC